MLDTMQQECGGLQLCLQNLGCVKHGLGAYEGCQPLSLVWAPTNSVQCAPSGMPVAGQGEGWPAVHRVCNSLGAGCQRR